MVMLLVRDQVMMTVMLLVRDQVLMMVMITIKKAMVTATVDPIP